MFVERCSLIVRYLKMEETHWNIEASQLLHAFLLQDPVFSKRTLTCMHAETHSLPNECMQKLSM